MTYSIAATDAATGQVGGAGASCIGTFSVTVIYGSVPGVGVVHAQAQLGGPGLTSAVSQLGAGSDPAAIIAAITAPAFDPNAAVRQYAIVDLVGRSAGFTGAQTQAYADDLQSSAGSFTFAVQGNILTSSAVLEGASAAFSGGRGCDLADRLMLALEAGAANGHGDSRCTSRDGSPADSAFLQVDLPNAPAGSYLRLDVTGSSPASPLPALRTQYDAWRASHPCPAPAPAADGADSSTSGGGCSAGPAGADLLLPLLAVIVLARRQRLDMRRAAV